MNSLGFMMMADLHDSSRVVAMMRGLYAEDSPAGRVDESRFPMTLQTLVENPERGCVVLFFRAEELVGYSILIPYWSNEFGGNLLFVDELYVMPGSRSQGIARAFFGFLEESKPFEAVALALEVSPKNKRARRLYESVGFVVRRNTTMVRLFT